MYVDLTPEQKALGEELRKYFAELLTPEMREAGPGEGGETYRQLVRRMARTAGSGSAGPKSMGGRAAR